MKPKKTDPSNVENISGDLTGRVSLTSDVDGIKNSSSNAEVITSLGSSNDLPPELRNCTGIISLGQCVEYGFSNLASAVKRPAPNLFDAAVFPDGPGANFVIVDSNTKSSDRASSATAVPTPPSAPNDSGIAANSNHQPEVTGNPETPRKQSPGNDVGGSAIASDVIDKFFSAGSSPATKNANSNTVPFTDNQIDKSPVSNHGSSDGRISVIKDPTDDKLVQPPPGSQVTNTGRNIDAQETGTRVTEDQSLAVQTNTGQHTPSQGTVGQTARPGDQKASHTDTESSTFHRNFFEGITETSGGQSSSQEPPAGRANDAQNDGATKTLATPEPTPILSDKEFVDKYLRGGAGSSDSKPSLPSMPNSTQGSQPVQVVSGSSNDQVNAAGDAADVGEEKVASRGTSVPAVLQASQSRYLPAESASTSAAIAAGATGEGKDGGDDIDSGDETYRNDASRETGGEGKESHNETDSKPVLGPGFRGVIGGLGTPIDLGVTPQTTISSHHEAIMTQSAVPLPLALALEDNVSAESFESSSPDSTVPALIAAPAASSLFSAILPASGSGASIGIAAATMLSIPLASLAVTPSAIIPAINSANAGQAISIPTTLLFVPSNSLLVPTATNYGVNGTGLRGGVLYTGSVKPVSTAPITPLIFYSGSDGLLGLCIHASTRVMAIASILCVVLSAFG